MPQIPKKCLKCEKIYWTDAQNIKIHSCYSDPKLKRQIDPYNKKHEIKKEKPKKHIFTYICKNCDIQFNCLSNNRVYCTLKCKKEKKIKDSNKKWIERDMNKRNKIPSHIVNEILERKRVYYSEGWMKKFKSVRG